VSLDLNNCVLLVRVQLVSCEICWSVTTTTRPYLYYYTTRGVQCLHHINLEVNMFHHKSKEEGFTTIQGKSWHNSGPKLY